MSEETMPEPEFEHALATGENPDDVTRPYRERENNLRDELNSVRQRHQEAATALESATDQVRLLEQHNTRLKLELLRAKHRAAVTEARHLGLQVAIMEGEPVNL